MKKTDEAQLLAYKKRFCEVTDQICEKYKIDLKDFASFFGLNLSTSVINNYRTGRNYMAQEILVEFEKIPEFDVYYVLFGKRTAKDKELTLFVSDDFNCPVIQKNDIVEYEKANSVIEQGFYIIAAENRQIVRKLQKTSESIKIIAVNKDYDDIYSEKIEVVGKVINLTREL